MRLGNVGTENDLIKSIQRFSRFSKQKKFTLISPSQISRKGTQSTELIETISLKD